jgi:hypothetical protein
MREKTTPTTNTLRNALLELGEDKIQFCLDDYGFDMFDDQKPSVSFTYEELEFYVPFAIYSAYIDKPVLVPNNKPETLIDMFLDHASYMMRCAVGIISEPKNESEKLSNTKQSERVISKWNKRRAKFNKTYSKLLHLDILETQWKVMPEYSKHSYDWLLEDDEEEIATSPNETKQPPSEKETDSEEKGGLMAGLGLAIGGAMMNGLLNAAGNIGGNVDGVRVVDDYKATVEETVEQLKEMQSG